MLLVVFLKCKYKINISPIKVSKTEVPRDVRNSKSRNKASVGEIGLNTRTHASTKVEHDQVLKG